MIYKTKMAHIYLDQRRIEFECVDPVFIKKWGGGSGIASWRLYNEVAQTVGPLEPENVVWIIGGPLTGTIAPCSGRIEVVTKSALTGLLGLSNTGGHFGARLKQAGLDGLVLHGVSEDPVYLVVRRDKIEFRDASHLWGRDTWETSEQVGAELNDPQLERVKVLAIGPAGEKLVRFACLINERYHAAGRGGAGAVLGSKKLKAIAVDTDPSVLPVPQAFRDAATKAAKKIKDHPTCKKYSRYGALPVSDSWAEMGCLPGQNYQAGTLPGWRETRGTERAISYVTRPRGTCYGCVMPCFNLVEVADGHYKGLSITSGTFVQVIFEFGAKCGIESLPAIWKCKEICHRWGMDYGSASGTLSFAMELFQRGLLKLEDTDGLALTWGSEEAAIQLLTRIALRQGLGDILAEGTSRASQRLNPGCSPYVMTIKGMEMMSPDVRSAPRAWALGSLTNPRGGDNVRGTHMRAEFIPDLSLLSPENLSDWEAYSKAFVSSLDMFPAVKREIYGDPPRVDPFTYRGKPSMVKWFEDLFSAVNALGLCIFPADKLALGPTDYAEMLSSFLEEEIPPDEFMEIGERIFNLQRLYILREGIRRKDDTWPSRFFEEDLPGQLSLGAAVSKETIDRVLDEYYRARGWNTNTGYPHSQTLSRLGLKEAMLHHPIDE
jgi:aldehyde:ferredoxin oxidoreductase